MVLLELHLEEKVKILIDSSYRKPKESTKNNY